MSDNEGIPSNLDFYREHANISANLSALREDVKEIKEVLVGNDKREGLVMDVDRLKRSRALFHAVLWVVFTSAIGIAATAIAQVAYSVRN